MFDPQRILGHLLRSSVGGTIHKGSSDWSSRSGLGLGLLGVALAAFEHFTEQPQAARPTSGTSDLPPTSAAPPPLPVAIARESVPTSVPPDALQSTPPPLPPTSGATRPTAVVEPATLLIRAMIAAADSDGEIDQQERAKILRAAVDSGLPEEDVEFLRNEIQSPRSMREIVMHADTPDLRHQVYAASRMAITVDCEAENRYLQALSVALYLTSDEVAQIEAQLG